MKENINGKLLQMLKGMDKDKFKNSTEAISDFISGEEGRKLKEALSDSDKQAILEKFLSLDENVVREKLKNADLSALGNLSADDIIKKLR